ncbi:hypothetical protein BGY98DRAFT_967471 [Russula aff. rugulosa BPL654]|nr:hypothetical protein BGY98DRAFT_967471 [Russula aff. rugulosa BPL654]
MHDYDFDSHDEFRQHDELDRFSHHEYPRPFDEYPPHHEYPPFHEDYRRQPHEIYPRPHNYPPPTMSITQSMVDLPDAKSIDLASMQFPHRRGEFSLPDAPALNAVHVNRRDEDPSPIAARNSNGFELPVPDGQMDIASVAARKRDGFGLGDMTKSGGAVPGIL